MLRCVDDLWAKYDLDGNGYLDKNEAKKFISDTLGSLGASTDIEDSAYDEAFAEFDTDNSGTITKNNMIEYMKKLLAQ